MTAIAGQSCWQSNNVCKLFYLCTTLVKSKKHNLHDTWAVLFSTSFTLLQKHRLVIQYWYSITAFTWTGNYVAGLHVLRVLACQSKSAHAQERSRLMSDFNRRDEKLSSRSCAAAVSLTRTNWTSSWFHIWSHGFPLQDLNLPCSPE